MRLHRPADEHRVVLPRLRHLQRLAVRQISQMKGSRAVDDDAHRASFAVFEHQNYRSVEIRVAELWHRNEKSGGEHLQIFLRTQFGGTAQRKIAHLRASSLWANNESTLGDCVRWTRKATNP